MKYNKKTIEDIDVKGKKVLVRCDFNVPQDSEGNITNDNRITAALPTIKYLMLPLFSAHISDVRRGSLTKNIHWLLLQRGCRSCLAQK